MANATPFYTRSPKTIVVYPINGQTEFTIPFEFLARKFVVVTLLGVDRLPLVLNTDYRFVSVNRIQLLSPVPDGYPNIELRRLTSATDRLVDFHDGSILRAYDLNLAQIQTMHVAEEARDLTADNIGVNDNGDLDARNRKIVNLANGTEPNDAVNLGQLRQFDTSTANNADRAEDAKNRAVQAETNTARDSASAAVNATKAVASAGTAVQAASDANRSKVAAETAESHVVPLVPIVDQAAKDAAEAAAKAEQAVTDVKNLGAVPIGSVLIFLKDLVPAGYLVLDGTRFDKLTYPDLFAYLGTDILPNFKDRIPKMTGTDLQVLQTKGWVMPTHNHTFNGTTSTFDYGTRSGGTDAQGLHHHDILWRIGGGGATAFTNASSSSEGWSSSWGNKMSDAGVHSHNVSVNIGAHNHTFSGTTNNYGSGTSVEVDHIGVVYAIKAAGIVADEGLAQLDGVIQKNIEQDSRLSILEEIKPCVYASRTLVLALAPNQSAYIPFNKIKDITGFVVDGSGFKAPKDGLYRVQCSITRDGSVNQEPLIYASVLNGSAIAYSEILAYFYSGRAGGANVSGNYGTFTGHTVLRLQAGQTVVIQMTANNGLPAQLWDSGNNLEITYLKP